MGTVSKEDLIRRRCREDEVELEGLGTVRVRGLTRGEIRKISTAADEGEDMEAWSLAQTMVEPALTEEDAAAWLTDGNFEDVAKVQAKINELSGIAGLAQKEAYKSPR